MSLFYRLMPNTSASAKKSKQKSSAHMHVPERGEIKVKGIIRIKAVSASILPKRKITEHKG